MACVLRTKKTLTAISQSSEPSYKWPKGRAVGVFRVSVDHDEECYHLIEQQYKLNAADAAVWTTLAEQRKTEQRQICEWGASCEKTKVQYSDFEPTAE